MNEYIRKAQSYDPKKHIIGENWFWSEKLDGRYFIWDGGITIGMDVQDVPWAYTDKDVRIFKSTGLWSSYGKPVFAPEEHIRQLKATFPYMVDGEIWLGRGRQQECMSISKRYNADSRWQEVKLMVFGAPLAKYFLWPRTIVKNKYTKIFPVTTREEWESKIPDIGVSMFDQALRKMIESIYSYKGVPPNVDLVDYRIIGDLAKSDLLKSICDKGGEGIMYRAPWDVWMPKRVDTILKHKPWLDAEATVVGYTAGREGKTGRLLGMLGALIVVWNGKRFELSGMTDEERVFHADPYETMTGGSECQGTSPSFPLGSKVTFRYRELTDAGIPKEARFWRKYEDAD